MYIYIAIMLIALLLIILDIILMIKLWKTINKKNMTDFEKTIIKIIIVIIDGIIIIPITIIFLTLSISMVLAITI